MVLKEIPSKIVKPIFLFGRYMTYISINIIIYFFWRTILLKSLKTEIHVNLTQRFSLGLADKTPPHFEDHLVNTVYVNSKKYNRHTYAQCNKMGIVSVWGQAVHMYVGLGFNNSNEVQRFCLRPICRTATISKFLTIAMLGVAYSLSVGLCNLVFQLDAQFLY